MSEGFSNAKYAFAISNETGQVVHIKDIQKSGLQCNCRCVKCEGTMVAKLGEIRDRHFAHHSKTHDVVDRGCNPQDAHETALHIMAKQIISESNWIMLPKFSLPGTSDLNCNLEDENQKKPHIFCDEEKFYYNNSLIEESFGKIRPDITINGEDKTICIEIAVFNKVKSEKEDYIKQRRIPCIEIDLSNVDIYDFNEETLKNILLNETDNKRWIYHFNQKQYEIELSERNKKLQGQNLTLDHATDLKKLSLEDTEKLIEELEAYVDYKQAVRVADILPRDMADLRLVFAKERNAPSNDEMKEILEILEKYDA